MRFMRKLLFVITLFSGQILFSQTVEKGVKHAGQHMGRGHRFTFLEFLLSPKFILMLIIAAVALILLLTKKMKKSFKISLLLISTFLFGLLQNIPGDFFSNFAMHPSPMCASTKPLLYGLRIPFMVTLFVIFLLTLIGPKLFCSYVCPIGAVQELVTMLGDKLKIKRYKFSFRLAYGIRMGLLILFLCISATAIIYVITPNGRMIPKSIYDYLNAFHGFEFEIQEGLIENIFHYLPFILTLILAIKIYRPFCHFVCPVGIYAHCLEQMSLFRVTLKKNSCTDCNICIEKSPCTAMTDILKDSNLRPDCYACNVCVESCPEKALIIGTRTTLQK